MPYGQIQVDTVKDSLNNTLAPSSSVFRNRIINGAMVIDQRNAGASVAVTATNTFVTDRFYVYGSQSSKLTAQQNAGSVTPPTGFSKYLGFTSLSNYSVLAADIFYTAQKIEGFNTADLGWGTANAKTVTLSFQVYSSLTGTFGGSINNEGSNYCYPFTYSIPVANTWTTISVTVAGPTAGTWAGATNGIGLYVSFGLGVGSTGSGTAGSWSANAYYSATGATSVVGTSGATFYITGVQLEKGENATSFDYRPYTTELQLCQRYLPAFNFSASNGSLGSGFANATTSVLINCVFPVQVRTIATGISVTGSFNAYTIIGGNSGNFTSITLAAGQSLYSGALNCTGGSGLTSGQGTFLLSPSGNSQILFTGCEL